MINWKVRYAALLERYPELFAPERGVLEVGSGTEGIARYLKRPVVGIDRVFGGAVDRHLTAVCGSVLTLPFRDDAFDDVVCVDTLEHLPSSDRLRAIRELVRVARKRVIISGPAGAFAAWGDAEYAKHIAGTGGTVPPWLAEHMQHGIPSLAELLAALLIVGCPFSVHVNEGVIQHYSGLFADNYPFMNRFLTHQDDKFPAEAPLRAAAGDVPYSYLFSIDVTSAPPNPSLASKSSPAGRELVPVTPGQRRVGIFAVGHRADRMPAISGIRRILAGAGGHMTNAGPEIVRDDVGENIACRNAEFSEMTAIYWVWKNVPDLDVVGFCHYRRYFDLRTNTWHPDRETRLRSLVQVRQHESSFADPAAIAAHLDAGSIIVSRPTAEGVANPEQYMTAHVPEHYLAMVNYVLEHHPQCARQVVAQARDARFYGNNMFIMPWATFDGLCRFWFDCLFGLEPLLGTRPGGYQRRVLAFLSERIFDIHMRWLRDSGQRIAEYPIFFLEESVFADGR
jgi:SAM-dependent methyltransferase